MTSFLLGGAIYALLAYVSYNETIKASNWYYALGLAAALAANLVWLHMARNEPLPARLALLGLYWDVMLTLTYLAVPVALYGARFTAVQWIGVGTVVLGIILTKVGV